MVLIDEKYIKNVLGEHTTLLKNIHKRILDIHRELMDTDGFIRTLSLKKVEWDRQGGGQGGIKKDLTDIMLLHQRLTREREIELRAEMCRLTDEEESVNRIWVCFQTLRGREYTYLNRLYVMRHPYKAAQAESGVSHRTFEKTRMGGVKRIWQLYDSDISNLQIINLSHKKSGIGEIPKEKWCEYEQLRLNV